jgi:hypothetical protein
MARTGQHEEKAPHKAGVGASRPRVQRWIIRMRVAMAAANCSAHVQRQLSDIEIQSGGFYCRPSLLGVWCVCSGPRGQSMPEFAYILNIQLAPGGLGCAKSPVRDFL